MRKIVLFLWLFCSILVITVLSACAAFEDPSQRATENAQNTALWTMVYDFQTQMPSMEAMAATADAAILLSTQLAEADSQNRNLRATNSALLANPPQGNSGFAAAPTAVGGGQPAGAVPTSAFSSASQAGVPGGNNATPFSTTTTVPAASTSNSTGAVAGVTSSGARFARSVTSTGRTEDGCAQGIQNTFSQTIESIYFTSEVRDIVQGVQFSLRIKQQDPNSSERTVASDPNFWVSDAEYDETCVWYNIDRSTMTFNVGTYTVEFLANGEVGAAATFVITAASNSAPSSDADDMQDSATQ